MKPAKLPTEIASTARRFSPASILCGFLIYAGVILFQLWHRADQSNLTGHPDEAAHFVTGVCVLEYCKTALGSNPVAFAESFYVRYPKVAFGHWPPLFYIVQGLWYGILGATPLQAILLVGFITAGAALILFLRLKRLHGIWIAALAIGVMLWLPPIRMLELQLMSDMLACLFTLLAILAFCDVWATASRRGWIMAGLWTVAAILTKESALSLLIFAPLALLLWSGKDLFLRKRLHRGGVAFCAVMAVMFLFYAISGVRLRSLPLPATLPQVWGRLPLLQGFFGGGSIAIFLTAAYGVADVLFLKRSLASAERVIHVRAALLWLATVLASQMFFRQGIESRYFLSAWFPAMMLFAQGLQSLRFGPRGLVAAGVTALCIVTMPGLGAIGQRTGYAEIAAAIPFDPVAPAILVSSDASGEGAMIVERLVRDKTRSGLVLRASKTLSSSDWMGRNQRLLAGSANEVREFLNRTPVHFIVVDMNGFIDPTMRAHHRLLEDAIRAAPAQFRLLGDFPLYWDGLRRDRAVQVYENLTARGHASDIVRIDMTNTLGRKLELHLKPRGQVAAAAVEPAGLPAWLLRMLPNFNRAETSFHIAPDKDSGVAGGGWGRIYVTAPPGSSWRVNGAPGWIKFVSGEGDATLSYRVAENDSNEYRSAEIAIGKETFEVRQPRSSYVFIPFEERFTESPAGWDSTADPPSRWVLMNLTGVSARASIATDGPEGKNSLTIEKKADKNPWDTMLYVPRIKVEAGAKYRLSLWLKAENSSHVSVVFGQRTAPYHGCGLDQVVEVSPAWKEVVIPFQVKAEGCEADNNRLLIQAGKIAGRLWLSQLLLTREAL